MAAVSANEGKGKEIPSSSILILFELLSPKYTPVGALVSPLLGLLIINIKK